MVFGDSHMPLHEERDGFQIFNPGSPTERRRSPRRSMGLATVDDGRLELATSHCHDSRVTTRAIAALAVLSAIALPGCGSSSESSVPGGADAEAARVIKEWADELRAGDVQAASDRFEIPAIVQNGTAPLRLTDRRGVVAFNESLPCGAKLTRAVTSGRYTIATFELTERPGPGDCGGGVGETAKTAFVIHDGRIAEWRRVVDLPPAAEPPTSGPVV